jgi:poly(A) polymerase
MRLRADAGEVDELLADWWQEFSTASDSVRQDLVDAARQEQQKRKPSPRMQRAPRPEAGSEQSAVPRVAERDATPDSTGDSGGDDAPRKRRRRRRRPGGGSGEGSAPASAQ